MRKRVILLLLTLVVILNILGCSSKQKTVILSDDIKKEAAMQDNEVRNIIDDGIDFLGEGKYDDAKSSFEKALSMDKSNTGAYIEIKNRYMEKQRIDDAYNIIKFAINNNVDVENMSKILEDIKSQFEVTVLDEYVYQNYGYELPTKVITKINNEDTEVDVVWNTSYIDTSILGTIKYEGKIEQYDRSVQLNLNVIEVEKITIIGGVSSVYEESGIRYLNFDEVEFFRDIDGNDRTAEIEAEKDGDPKLVDGRVLDGYYIRNLDKSLETYEISPNVDISVCSYMINSPTSIDQEAISYEIFKTLDMSDRLKFTGLLCHIYLENNVVVRIEQQYIP